MMIFLKFLFYCLKNLLKDTTAECNISKQDLLTLARCMLPDIQNFFESEKGKEEYKKYQEEKIEAIEKSVA